MMKPESTHEFTTVESFSKLPFLRPPPQNSSSSASAIRLFGIDVPHDHDRAVGSSTSNNNNNSGNSPKESSSVPPTSMDAVRRFECHYCCRNFPTSQALGGHQNAHKRERQHAKRAHLHAAVAAHHHFSQYQLHPPPVRYYYTSPTPHRLGLGSPSQPITGSPLPGLWRVPQALNPHVPAAQPLFKDGGRNFMSPSPWSSMSSSSIATSMNGQLACEPGAARVPENVSLDLHL